jgi:hypothetical protein
MTRQVIAFWAVLILAFAACGAIAYAVAPPSNQSFADAAAVLAFASLLAIGIERVVEFGWLIVDAAKGFGGYFPLNVLMQQFREVDAQTDALMGDVFKGTRKVLDDAIAVGKEAGEAVESLETTARQLDLQRRNLEARLTEVRKLAPGSGRLATTADIVEQLSTSMHAAVVGIGKADDAVTDAIVAARASAKTALEVITAVGDNPSRRIASLLVSSGLGILVAGFVGVNLFKAVLDQSQGSAEAVLFGKLGVVVTGLVLGLGSGPTHELVKGLQRYKDSRGRTAIADLTSDASGRPAGAPSDASSTPQLMIRSTH